MIDFISITLVISPVILCERDLSSAHGANVTGALIAKVTWSVVKMLTDLGQVHIHKPFLLWKHNILHRHLIC